MRLMRWVRAKPVLASIALTRISQRVLVDEQLGRVRLALEPRAAEQLDRRLGAHHLLAEQRGLLEELHHVVAVRRAQRRATSPRTA